MFHCIDYVHMYTFILKIDKNNIAQRRRTVQKSGGIICPPGRNRVDSFAQNWEAPILWHLCNASFFDYTYRLIIQPKA